MGISFLRKAGVLLATITLCGAAVAADKAGTSKAGASGAKSSLDSSDRKFMEKAAIGGMAEVELGNLAKQNASNAQVKQFGDKMAQDHGKANDELKQLASSKGVTLPTSLDSSHKKDMDKLSKLQGDKFDREYMDHMVKDHKKDVKEFQKAAKDAKDPDVKAFAAKTLPTLEGHLQIAENTDSAVKGKNRTAGAMNMGSSSSSVSGNTANISGNAPTAGNTSKATSTQSGTTPR